MILKHQLKNKGKKHNDEKRCKRYRTIIEKENVSKHLKTGDFRESYNKRSTKIETSKKNCSKSKNKNPRKDIKELRKICKCLREKYSATIELHEKILILQIIKVLKEHITEKYKEGRSIAQEIEENNDSGGKIWELKGKLEKITQKTYSITNNEGIKMKNRSDIQEEY